MSDSLNSSRSFTASAGRVLCGIYLVAAPGLARAQAPSPEPGPAPSAPVAPGASAPVGAEGVAPLAPAAPVAEPPPTAQTELPASSSLDPAANPARPTLQVAEPVAVPGGKKDKGKTKKAKHGEVSLSGGGYIGFKGRVFARAELAHRNRDRFIPGPGGIVRQREGFESLDFTLPSARFSVEYEAPMPWLSATIEIEAADNVELKDGYIDARGKNLFARVGQFKIPMSAIELESPWKLPLVRRGFVNTLLTDWLDVAGRRPGLVVGVRAKGLLKPRLSLGAFQGESLSSVSSRDRDTDLIEEVSVEAQTFVARAQIDVANMEIGAWYAHRLGSAVVGETDHYFTTGADIVFDHVLPGGGVRAWLDAIAGASWYVHPDKQDDGNATFLVGRALVGYRFGGVLPDAPYVEPFGYLAVLEPDLDFERDLAWEAALGVNVGYWQRARVTLQGEINQDQRNFPNDQSGYLAGFDPDRLGLLLQVGLSF